MILSKIPYWCAGIKLSGLTNESKPTIQQILDAWKPQYTDLQGSIIVVSCGADEKELRDHLKSIGFYKHKSFINYGHSSGKTWLMSYQIPKDIWCEKTGFNGKGTWTTG